ACRHSVCAAYEPASGTASGAADTGIGANARPVTVVSTSSGDSLVVANDRRSPTVVLVFQSRVPSGALRPTVTSVPRTLGAGEPVTIEGTRFQHSPAAGSGALGPQPSILPSVVFMPVGGGGPIRGPLSSWSDTRLVWRAPQTVYQGPGWLHVVV